MEEESFRTCFKKIGRTAYFENTFLANSFEQLGGGGKLEAASEDHDRLESRRALATLQQAYLGSMQVAHVGERLLGKPNAPAMAAQVGGELLADGLHRAHCRGPQTEGLQTKVGTRSPTPRCWFE